MPWYVPIILGGLTWTPVQPGAALADLVVLTPWVMFQRFGPEAARRSGNLADEVGPPPPFCVLDEAWAATARR
ncbi:hypothetical protein [Streptomyces scabiei]|uniref:hypothetical protein n=1 Tax=Streptomyces scabiei TaxID=1930 RepID=UPI001F286BA9